MLGLSGVPLPEEHRATSSALELFSGTRDLSVLPSPQRMASLHRFLVRRFVDDESMLLTQKQRMLIDSGIWLPSNVASPLRRSSALVVRTLSEWVEDSRRAFADEDEGAIFSYSLNAVLASENRMKTIASRIRTMLPLLLSTLGNLTSDGGLFIMPKQRAEMLARYFLESLDTAARSVMRFRAPEAEEEDSPEEAERKQNEAGKKLASFPKLIEGFRRMKSIAKDEDGSDLVVERLLSSIESLFLESLILYSSRKSLAEIKRRKKVLRQKANETHFSPGQSLLEILKQELDRIYAAAERSCKAFSFDGSSEKIGYSPLVLPEIDEDRALLDEDAHDSKKKKRASENDFENAYFNILSADRGIFATQRVRSRGLPEVLLLPGSAVGSYDKTGDCLVLPFSATSERPFEHLLNAFGSFRWGTDSSGRILNMWADLVGSRGARPMLELESSFRHAYSSWLRFEILGGAPPDERAEAVGAALRPEGDFFSLYGIK